MALVYQLQHENPKSDITGRNYSNMYVSADKLQESCGTANTWTAKKIAKWGTKHYYRYQKKCRPDLLFHKNAFSNNFICSKMLM